MPGHYVKCLVEASFASIFEALGREFGNIHTRKFSGNQDIGVILGQRYFLRVNSDVAIAIILKSVNTEKTEVEIISSAGAAGITGMTWNAHKVFASKVKEHLARKFKSRVESEISYFRTGRVPNAFLKKCMKCSREIPIASLECPYCKSKQP